MPFDVSPMTVTIPPGETAAFSFAYRKDPARGAGVDFAFANLMAVLPNGSGAPLMLAGSNRSRL